MRSSVVGWIASGVVFAAASSAWAQDYTVTTATGLLETRPASAVIVPVKSGIGPFAAQVTLPFDFPYYGSSFSSTYVNHNGCLVPTAVASPVSFNSTSASNHGPDATSGGFPYTGDADGVIAPLWLGYANVNNGPTTGFLYTWVAGTAPARRCVISWENVSITGSDLPRTTIQVHLYEGSGRIVFAYANVSGAYTKQYVCGIDSGIDSRFTAPLTAGRTNTGYPGSDFILDPRAVPITGTLLYDKIVSDASGIGNSVQPNTPLGGCRIEIRRSGMLNSLATTAPDGTFTAYGIGLPSSATGGSLAVVAQNAACRVLPATGSAPTEWIAANSSISFSSASNVGTLTLGSGANSTGAVRSAFNVARSCLAVRDWAAARTTKTIAQIDVAAEPANQNPTGYSAVTGIRIATPASANSDVWDDGVIAKTYARHVLASVAASPTTGADYRFDAVTDPQNAFAEAFGCYLWAVVSGTATVIDGKSSNPATVFDLESPSITVTKGPDVAGCVAGALYDLVDASNETTDAVDGRLTPGRAFAVVDTFTVCPTAATFLQAWVDAGFDGPSITRTFIGDRALPDDASEPNDDRTEAPSIGTVGVRRSGLVLNRYNEDWFSVTLPSQSPLRVDAAYDRLASNASVALEVRDAAGALVTTGAAVGVSGPVHAEIASVPAGSYRIGVRHLSGVTVPTYTVQAYLPLVMDQTPLTDWTLGRPFDQTLGVAGGVPGYTLGTLGSALPPGLSFSPLDQHVVGTPTTVGSFGFTIQLQDTGVPANFLSRSRNVTIHDVFALPIAPFVGFPLGKSGDTTLPSTGGTPPFTLSMTTGALPSGLAFDPNTLHVTGTVTAGRSTTLELDGVDVAGSADHVATRAVVAVPASGKNVPADLVTGADACGWWFDAVQGSTVSFTAATAKKRAKRTLVGAVLAPNRSLVLTGKIRAKPGSLTGGGIVCPLSGRYYVIASSDSGDATQLLGNVRVAPPKSGKAKPVAFTQSDTTSIQVGALPGAVLTLKFAGEKKTTLVARIVGVTDPTGAPVGTAQFVKPSATGGTLTMTLPTGGTWTIVLGATSTSGVPGKLSYSYTLKQPKGVTYSAD